MSKGFSLLELLVVVAMIGILMAILVPLMESAMVRAHIGAMASDAKVIHAAFKQHYVDNNMYPNSSGSPKFELASFEPLVDMGYYDGKIISKLKDNQADAYDSPDDTGTNQEFWVELTLRQDHNVRFLVADSNDAPLSGGEYMDGIYLFHKGALTPFGSSVK